MKKPLQVFSTVLVCLTFVLHFLLFTLSINTDLPTNKYLHVISSVWLLVLALLLYLTITAGFVTGFQWPYTALLSVSLIAQNVTIYLEIERNISENESASDLLILVFVPAIALLLGGIHLLTQRISQAIVNFAVIIDLLIITGEVCLVVLNFHKNNPELSFGQVLFMLNLLFFPRYTLSLGYLLHIRELKPVFRNVQHSNVTEAETYEKRVSRYYLGSDYAKITGLSKKQVCRLRNENAESSGRFGEYEAFASFAEQLPGKQRWLINYIVPVYSNGKVVTFQEIDALCFWRNRIFIIEAKRMNQAVIYADENSPVWTIYRTRQKTESRARSYFLQNHEHSMYLQAFLEQAGINVEQTDDFLITPVLYTSGMGVQFSSDGSELNLEAAGTSSPVVAFKNLPQKIKTWERGHKGRKPTPEVQNAYDALSDYLQKHPKVRNAYLMDQRKNSASRHAAGHQYLFDYEKNKLLRETRFVSDDTLVYTEELTLYYDGSVQWQYRSRNCGLTDSIFKTDYNSAVQIVQKDIARIAERNINEGLGS